MRGWGWGKRTVRQNSLSPPITPYVFVLHFDFKNAPGQGCGEALGSAVDNPVRRALSGVQFSLSFGAGIFGREEKGSTHSQLSRQGQRAGSSKFALSLLVHFFYPHTPAQSTDNGGYVGVARRLCSRTSGSPASCSSRLGARNHNNSNSYHNDAG